MTVSTQMNGNGRESSPSGVNRRSARRRFAEDASFRMHRLRM